MAKCSDKLRILLVEDSAVNQMVAARLLEKQGYQVEVAGEGEQAVARVESEHFVLVLMDVQMPGMDGFEAAVRIREMERSRGTRVPIVAMTAHASQEDHDRCLAAGMDGYICKPFRLEELLQLMRELHCPAALQPVA